MLCPNCGAMLHAGAMRCPECGTMLNKKKHRRPRRGAFWPELLIGLLAVGMVIAIVIGALSATGNLHRVLRAIHLVRDSSTASVYEAPLAPEPPEAMQKQEVSSTQSVDASAPEPIERPTVSAVPAPEDDTLQSAAEPLSEEALEAAVAAANEKYGRILSALSSANSVRRLYPDDGVTYTYLNGSLAMVRVRSGEEASAYARAYYYDNGSLFLASFETEEEGWRLYIQDGILLRLSHIPDLSDRTSLVNADQQTDEDFLAWQTLAVTEGQYYRLDSLTAQAPEGKPESEYVIPDSNSRYLSSDDLIGFSAEECRLARNEIYARHGRRFLSATLQRYFDAQSWYEGTVEPEDFSDAVFNDFECANYMTILAYEDERGYR